MAESKYQTRWQTSANGGSIMRLNFRCWYAIPSNKLGMNHLRAFDNIYDATSYADSIHLSDHTFCV